MVMTQPWQALLSLADDELPRVLVTEGSWWRADREADRLPLLTDVRALPFPDWWWGRYRGVPVVYACLYGAARVVEPVHVLGELGLGAVVQIGSCGGVDPTLRTGDLVVPGDTVVREGASPAYGGQWDALTTPDPDLADLLVTTAGAAHHPPSAWPDDPGRHLTTSALLAQPPELVAAWRAAEVRTVDMETSAVMTAGRAFGVRAASLLYVWDTLPGRSWLDLLPAEVEARRRGSELTLMPVALDAALEVLG